MAIVRPFRAVRPLPKFVQEFACPPYDVLEEDEVRAIVAKKPNSYLKVTRSEVDFPEGTDPHSEVVYAKGASNMQALLRDGVLVEDDKPAFYLYRETWKGKSQTGLFATFSVDEYDKEIIKKHELTRQDKEDDRTLHITTLASHAEPVFLTYKAKSEIKNLINAYINKYEKLYELTDENEVKHELWKVDNEEEVESLRKEFDSVEYLYIADGHHRAAASSRAQKVMKEKNTNHTGEEEYNFFMAAIFPDDELRILDYNRVVKDLNGMTKEEFLSKISEKFEYSKTSETPYSPKNLHEFGMYIGGEWYVMKAKPEIVDSTDPVKDLDVYILQEYLLDPILGIDNPRKDPRIHFLGGIRGVKALEEWCTNKDWALAFSMYATPLSQLENVADAGQIMPPKSTWFEPKLKSGLTIHMI